MKKEGITEVSKEEFAEALYYWLSEHLKTEVLKERAKELKFEIKTDEDFNEFFAELTILNMWMVVDTCEALIKDENLRDECLDAFHKLVFERNASGGQNGDFDKWIKMLAQKYLEYSEAMGSETSANNPLWEVAKVFNKNLFGKIKKDFWFQQKAEIYIGTALKHLGKALKEYNIVQQT